ncbi:hypothetical protein AAMO2058_001708300, partial [Amorphochlora amoebiformis]
MSGRAGKKMDIKWKYLSSSGDIQPYIESYVNSYTETTLTLEGTQLNPGTHTFLARATNWLGMTSTSMISITRLANDLPSVKTPGGYQFSIDPDRDIRLEIEVFTSTCANNTAVLVPGIARWAQEFRGSPYLNSRTASYSSILSNHQVSLLNWNRMVLYIPPNTLQPGSTYAFNAFSSAKSTTSTGLNTTYIITVSEPNVVASLAGGSLREVSVLTQSPKMVIFNASGSIDPSAPEVPPQAFQWTLYLVSNDDFGNEILTPISLRN